MATTSAIEHPEKKPTSIEQVRHFPFLALLLKSKNTGESIFQFKILKKDVEGPFNRSKFYKHKSYPRKMLFYAFLVWLLVLKYSSLFCGFHSRSV